LLLVIQKLWSLSMFQTILHVCVSLPFPEEFRYGRKGERHTNM
jgi:hypothetical protein